MRSEIYVAIQEQNKLAAQLASSEQEPASFQNLRDLLAAESGSSEAGQTAESDAPDSGTPDDGLPDGGTPSPSK